MRGDPNTPPSDQPVTGILGIELDVARRFADGKTLRKFVQPHCFANEAESLVHCAAAEPLGVFNELGGIALRCANQVPKTLRCIR